MTEVKGKAVPAENAKVKTAQAKSANKPKKVPKVLRAVYPNALPKRKEGQSEEDFRKSLPPLRKSKVRQSRHAIMVMKREGGTIRYAKYLRNIRKTRDLKIKQVTERAKRAQIRAANKAAVKSVKGKTSKSGQKLVPQFGRQQKFKVEKMRKFYKTQLALRKLPAKNFFKDMNTKSRRHIARLRKSLVPGTVVIMTAGRFRCKKAIFLKQLPRSGLCLITGPFLQTGVPLRRISQNYLIATSLRLNLGDFKVPRHINDAYFKKVKEAKPKKKTTDEEIFKDTKKVKKGPTAQRKKDQKAVDEKVFAAIKKRKDKSKFLKYMNIMFGLQGQRYVHNIKF